MPIYSSKLSGSNFLDVTGSASIDGSVVFNESSGDKDFRVESDGNAAMLFVDGSTDRVGIGTSTPGAHLEVSAEHPTLLIKSTAASGDGSIKFQSGDGSAMATIRADVTSNTLNHLSIGKSTDEDNLVVDASGFVGVGVQAPATRFAVSGDASITGSLDVMAGTDGAAAQIALRADQADDAADTTTLSVADGGAFTIDCGGDINLDADGADVVLKDAGTQFLKFTNSSADCVITNGAADKDIIFKDTGGNEVVRVDGSAESLLMASGKELQFADAGEHISGDGSTLSVVSEAGSIAIGAALADGQTLKLGKNGAVETIIAPHGTAGSEKYSVTNTAGTSVTEGDAAVQLTSAAGGVGIRSTANLANAVNITVDGGTTSTMTLFNDQGTSVTEGAASIQLLSDAGGIGIKSTANLANAILLTADGGTSETIKIHADQGSGAGSIELTSDAGGVDINAGTTFTLDSSGAGSIDFAADASNITLTTDGAAEDFTISLAGATDSSLILSSTGTGADALQISTSAGGMDITVAGAAAGEDLDISCNQEINVTSTSNAANAIYLRANGGTSETIKIHADQGSGAGSIELTSDAGGVDVNAAGAISLDSSAGSIDINVVDGQTVNVGLNGAVETIWSPHGTAGSELWSTINTAGTTDGSDAAGAILLSAVAGGIGLAWADDKDLWAEGGQFVVTANHDAAGAIKLHADAGSSQTILIQNDAGTTDGTDGAGSILLAADAGGISLAWADGKDLWAEGGRAVITANEDAADCIKLHADAGSSQTITMVNDAGTNAAAIALTATAGGITLTSGATTATEAITVTASQTTKDVLQVTADSVTTANVMDVTADALTTGRIFNLVSNSSTTGARELVKIHNDHTSATNTTCLYVRQDARQNGGEDDNLGAAVMIETGVATGDTALLALSNVNADANGPIMEFLKEAESSAADDDDIGTIKFIGLDSGDNETEFAKILVESSDVTNGDEGGKMTFSVFAGGTAGTAASANLFSIGGEDVANGTACEVVVNDASVDCDFRVESDASTHMFFVDAGNNRIGFANSAPEAALSVGAGKHVVTTDVTVTPAHNGDNTVIAQLSGVIIPQYALITRVIAVVKTASNLGTHLCNIQLSTTNGTAADSSISSGTEILGAGMGADAEDAYSTDNADGDTKEDVNLKEGKEVFLSEGVVSVAADSYVYVCNAGTGNGTSNASSGVLTVIIEYYGMT